MDSWVVIDCGRGWVRQGRAMGENWDNCNRTTIKQYKIKSNKKEKRKCKFNYGKEKKKKSQF